MSSICPSCLHPVNADETQQYEAGGSVTRCSNCGVLLSDDEPTSTYHRPAAKKHSRIGNFTLVRMLGSGGFGAVWLAEDQNLGRQVALKLPKVSGKDAQLLHEAQTAAKLRHPNIVSIYEVGTEQDQVFIASEFVDGEDLRSELSQGRPDIARATHLIAVIARAVEHAHEHGVVHRDLKPANIILNAEGEPFITDFGIAKQLSAEATISTGGAVLGTISYMSPEQARGSTRDTDHRADIYALGVMLFEMLTEYRPFRGNARAIIHQKIYEDPPSPRKLVPTLPRDLETICLKCLEREPPKRYASAADLADELDRFEHGMPIKARPISRSEKAWRWCRRQPAIAALLLGFFLSLTFGLLGVSYFGLQATRSEEHTRRSLYRTRMNLASKLWASGDIAGLERVLQEYEADASLRELRGFAWYHFKTLTEPFVRVVNHGEVVTDVAVSHDGSLFAAAGADRIVRVWDAKTGNLVRSLQHPAGRIAAIHFSPLDNRLVSASSDGIVRVWNPQQHDHPAVELNHGSGLSHVRFAPDGKSLVSGSRNGGVRFWQTSSREQIGSLQSSRSGIEDLRFSPDGQLVAIATQDGAVSVWDAKTRELVRRIATNSRLLSVTFADAGTVAAGSYGSRVQYWSLESGERTAVVQLGGAVGDLEYLPDEDLLAAVSTLGDLRLFDRNQHQIRSTSTHALTHGMLAQSRDGRWLVVGSGDGSVKLLRVASLRRPDTLWHDAHVRAVAFVPDKPEIATAVGDGSVHTWNLDTNEGREIVAPSGKEMLAVAARPGSNLLAASGMTREVLLLGTGDTPTTDDILLDYSGFSSLAYSSDGQTLACGGRNGTLLVYDHGSYDGPRFQVTSPDVQINAIVFTADDAHVLVGYSDSRVVAIQMSNGSVVDRGIRVPSTPLAMVLCNDRREVAIGTQAGEIHFHDAASGRLLRTLKAHSSRVNALAAFPDGHRIVSGGRDRELRIWDVPSGELITSLAGHARQVFSIAISPDATTIVSAGLAGAVRIWRSEP